MTRREAAEVLRAGDILAEMLGYTLAAIEGGKWPTKGLPTEQRLAAGRDAIVSWHRMRSRVS